jgi:5-methyltetrahydropteroyltriglutamate--homocysteine methyltransferase
MYSASGIPDYPREPFLDDLVGEAGDEIGRARVLELLGRLGSGGPADLRRVIDPIDPRVEAADEVRARVLDAARYIDPDHLGTTDDCRFSPFGGDASTSRDIAFAKIAARVEGTAAAARDLGV